MIQVFLIMGSLNGRFNENKMKLNDKKTRRFPYIYTKGATALLKIKELFKESILASLIVYMMKKITLTSTWKINY
jgi:hypothetical protein